MFANLGLNFNQHCTNPFASGTMSSNMFSMPYCGGFDFYGDIASQSLFSGMNSGLSYTNFLSPMLLPYAFSDNTGYFSDVSLLANPYMNFANGGIASMLPFGQSSNLTFYFSVPEYSFSTLTTSGRTSTSSFSSGTSAVSPFQVSTVQTSSVSQTGSSTRRTVKYGKDLSAEFINKTKLIAMNLNCNYEDLLAVMNAESGLNPQARNSSSGAVGLIQFTPVAIKELNRQYGLHLTSDKIRNMSAIEQLDLVGKYLTMTKKRVFSSDKKLSGDDLYSLVFLPGRASGDTLTRAGEGYYRANRGLDVDGDGKITKSDLAQHINSKKVYIA